MVGMHHKAKGGDCYLSCICKLSNAYMSEASKHTTKFHFINATIPTRYARIHLSKDCHLFSQYLFPQVFGKHPILTANSYVPSWMTFSFRACHVPCLLASYLSTKEPAK